MRYVPPYSSSSLSCSSPVTFSPSSFSQTLIFPLLVFRLALTSSYHPSSTWHELTPRFIAFIAGSFAAVLLSASLIDPDLFLHFEITPHRTVLFYLGIFGTILAVSRGMVPEENLVFDPEATLREVVWWTHYLPAGWKGKLHSKMVRLPFPFLNALLPLSFRSALASSSLVFVPTPFSSFLVPR